MTKDIANDRIDFPNALFATLLHPELLDRIFADPTDKTNTTRIKVCVFISPSMQFLEISMQSDSFLPLRGFDYDICQ